MTPGPGLPRFGSLLATIAKRSPLGSHEKSVTVSAARYVRMLHKKVARRTLQLDHLDRKVLFAHAENLEAAENRFFRLGMAVDTHAEKVSLILPIQPTLNGWGCVSKLRAPRLLEMPQRHYLPLRH